MEIERLRNDVPHHEEMNIIKYLRSCRTTSITFHYAKDPLSNKTIGTPNDYHNGKWFWQETLAYYVEQYHVCLPNEFIQDMENDNWQWNCNEVMDFRIPVRVLSESEIDEIVSLEIESIELYDDQSDQNYLLSGMKYRELLKKQRQELINNLSEICKSRGDFWYYLS